MLETVSHSVERVTMHSSQDYLELLRACHNKLRLSKWFMSLSLREYAEHLDSEVHETILAIDNKDKENLREELGDVFWCIHALILKAGDEYGFDFESVVSGVVNKFRRRKPHIFEGTELSLEEEVAHWFRVKDTELKRHSEK